LRSRTLDVQQAIVRALDDGFQPLLPEASAPSVTPSPTAIVLPEGRYRYAPTAADAALARGPEKEDTVVD
jgi:hypothetical protein